MKREVEPSNFSGSHRGAPGRGQTTCPRPTAPAATAGYTLVELMFAVGLVAVLSGITVPLVLASLDRSRGAIAARYLAARMALARAQWWAHLIDPAVSA